MPCESGNSPRNLESNLRTGAFRSLSTEPLPSVICDSKNSRISSLLTSEQASGFRDPHHPFFLPPPPKIASKFHEVQHENHAQSDGGGDERCWKSLVHEDRHSCEHRHVPESEGLVLDDPV